MKKIISTFLFVIICQSVWAQDKSYTLEDAIINEASSYYPSRMLHPNWMDNETFSVLNTSNYGQLLIIKAESGDTIETISSEDIIWPEGIKVSRLVGISWVDSENFRMIADAKVLLVNKNNKIAKVLLSDIDKKAENKKYHAETNTLAYTIKNNLYLQTEKGKLAITKDKDTNIVSGQAIHRFEFGIKEGVFWSPNGENLAYYQKDESKVSNYPLLDITTTPGSLKSIKYPMAGQDSEEGNVFVYNVKKKKSVKLEKQGGREDYVTNLAWTAKGDQLVVAEVNRAQKHMDLNLFDAKTGKYIKTLYSESHEKWVEPEHPAFFVDENTFIWLSEKDGFMNLYKVQLDDSKVEQLTYNKWVTKSIFDKSEDGKIVYFYGTGKSPLDNKLFAVNWTNGEQWEVTTERGWHSVTISPNKDFFINQWSSDRVPWRVDYLSSSGKVLNMLLESDNPMKGYQEAISEIGTIKAADDETDLYYRMIKPYNFDVTKKYPVLVYVYGGPHAQMVTNRYRSGAPIWMHWLANQGYVVFTLDNRGSANRGYEFESVIHRQLGENEMLDQLKGVEFLKQQPFINADKMAVHGWSYGGFMTSSLMLRYPDAFKVGVAGGPVTDWKWYEIMYCERYMDHPENNPEGFESTRVMNYVDSLKGDLLLIHGTVDDVVLMQHNLALVKAFVDAGKQVDFFPYPMHPHNVLGRDRAHLMRKVLLYVQDKLGEEEFQE